MTRIAMPIPPSKTSPPTIAAAMIQPLPPFFFWVVGGTAACGA